LGGADLLRRKRPVRAAGLGVDRRHQCRGPEPVPRGRGRFAARAVQQDLVSHVGLVRHRSADLLQREPRRVRHPGPGSDLAFLRGHALGGHRPVFVKIWSTPNSGYAERFKHIIEPSVEFRYLTTSATRTASSRPAQPRTTSSAARADPLPPDQHGCSRSGSRRRTGVSREILRSRSSRPTTPMRPRAGTIRTTRPATACGRPAICLRSPSASTPHQRTSSARRCAWNTTETCPAAVDQPAPGPRRAPGCRRAPVGAAADTGRPGSTTT